MRRLVSVSGGKDSTATLLVALESHPHDEVMAAFADTGNEHEATYGYVRYLEDALGVPIKWLRQDFTDWWWQRRTYVAEKWPGKGVDAATVARALAVYDKGPFGNPYLDLCVIKNRFPSRRTRRKRHSTRARQHSTGRRVVKNHARRQTARPAQHGNTGVLVGLRVV